MDVSKSYVIAVLALLIASSAATILPNPTADAWTAPEDDLYESLKCGNVDDYEEYKNTWQAYVFAMGTVMRTPLCGGSLITDQWVVTTAGCLGGRDPKKYKVALGEKNRELDIYLNTAIVEAVYIPKNFKRSSLDYNIALLKLANKVKFTDQIRPICLPSGASSVADLHCQIKGPGLHAQYRNQGGPTRTDTLSSPVKVISNNKCRNIIGDRFRGLVKDTMICSALNADTCSYLPGNALACSERNKWSLQGITNRAWQCSNEENYPSVYTSVAKMLEWIRKTMSEQ